MKGYPNKPQRLERAPHLDEILSTDDVVRWTGLARTQVLRAAQNGLLAGREFPPPVGHRFTERAVLAWLEGRTLSGCAIGLAEAVALLASLHDGVQARFLDDTIEIEHDGQPGVWHRVATVRPDVMRTLEARWHRLRAGIQDPDPWQSPER